MTLAMVGRKVGMIRLYDGTGRVRPCTVVELGPNRITQLRTLDRDGYQAVQIGYAGDRKRITRPARGHLREAGIEDSFSLLQEQRVGDSSEYELGQELSVGDFTPGEFVDVTATSKGRGFAGVVRRWSFRGGPKSHGQSDKHRGAGSVGAGTTPGRTWRGQKMGGHMGARRKMVLNLLLVQTDPARNLVFIQGSVPGARNGIVTVSQARRPALTDYEPPPSFAVVEADESVAAGESAETDDAAIDDAAPDDTATEDTATDETDANGGER